MLRPIEIVGGGLAGLSLGHALQRRGVPTTVVEAGDYPRHRVCGEFITGLRPATRDSLELDGILRDALRHREVAWFLRDDPTHVKTLPEPALGISRHTLDARLARAFVAAGGTLRTRTRLPADAAAPGRVFATGRRPARSPWLGLKVHVRGIQLQRDLELHLGGAAYVGLCRIEADEVNVCGLFHRRRLAARGAELLLAYLRAAGMTRLAGRLAQAAIDDASFCAVAALGFDRTFAAPPDRVAIGDAAAMIPPFTGNGMAMAFQSAAAALEPLLAFARGGQSWDDTARAIQRSLRSQFRVRLASAGMLHPFLLRAVGQRWQARLARAGLLPWGPLYRVLH